MTDFVIIIKIFQDNISFHMQFNLFKQIENM